MNIYQALQIGNYHTNHCEDYLFCGEIGNDKLLCAVMDGCTMATDSYFASTLVGKLLRKISIEKGYKELYKLEPSYGNVDQYLKSILKELFSELLMIKNQLVLDKKELLTTLILLLVDKKQNKGVVLVIGDGLVSINGELTEFDQENKPDYLGFHLGEDFEDWYSKQTQKIFFENGKDLSIATDGILTFTKVKKIESAEPINAVEFLLLDTSSLENPDMLNYKLKYIENKAGLKPTDDLGIVRIVL